MIQPDYLKKGDKIGIVAPARKISKKEIQYAIKAFKTWDLEIIYGENLFQSFHQFSNTDKVRAYDLQTFLDNPYIKAIFCARGGYGTIRIIPFLNFNKFIQKPKWIIGFSDITILHSLINKQLNTESIHGIMPFNINNNFNDDDSAKSLKKTIFEGEIEYEFSSNKLNRKGYTTGELTGGNLSVLYSLIGTNLDVDYSNKILFIEDIDEYLYHIDRMIISLKMANKLSNLKGLIIGGMTDIKDNEIPFGKNTYEIIYEAVKEYNYPVAFNLNSGHTNPNLALILGRKIELKVENKYSRLVFTRN